MARSGTGASNRRTKEGPRHCHVSASGKLSFDALSTSTVEGPYIYTTICIQSFIFYCSIFGAEALSSCPPVPGSYSYPPPLKTLLEAFHSCPFASSLPLHFSFWSLFLGLVLWLEPLFEEVSQGTRPMIPDRPRRSRLLHFWGRASNGLGNNMVSRSSFDFSPMGRRVGLTTRL